MFLLRRLAGTVVIGAASIVLWRKRLTSARRRRLGVVQLVQLVNLTIR